MDIRRYLVQLNSNGEYVPLVYNKNDKPDLKKKENSSLNSAKKRHSKKFIINCEKQYAIDFGQKDFDPVECKVCKMLYTKGDVNDEKHHTSYHDLFVNSIKFSGWKLERTIFLFDNGDKIISIYPNDPKYMINKLKELIKISDKELGIDSSSDEITDLGCLFLIYISHNRRIGGFIAGEKIEYASPVVSEQPWSISTLKIPAEVGVSRLWVHSNFKRNKIAKSLIDILRANLYNDKIVAKERIAFSGSTLSGVDFAKTYTTEIGKLNKPKIDGSYDIGQFFLHRVFGYRGVLLYSWTAKVYDKDISSKKQTKVLDEKGSEFDHFYKNVKGCNQTYYQALMDFRDSPFIRSQVEAVTFLSSQKNSKQLFAIPGLDYVSHEDIIPYDNTDTKPILNDLFEKFLCVNSEDNSKYKATDVLLTWQEKNYSWLQLSDVYKETTNNIRITVIPFYIGNRIFQNSTNYWWRYCIRIENLGEQTVRLRERNWTIYSMNGHLETMAGIGVIGQEPILSKSQPAFQYSSHVNLQSSSGHMTGVFKMEREDNQFFECKIPSFSLNSKEIKNVDN